MQLQVVAATPMYATKAHSGTAHSDPCDFRWLEMTRTEEKKWSKNPWKPGEMNQQTASCGDSGRTSSAMS